MAKKRLNRPAHPIQRGVAGTRGTDEHALPVTRIIIVLVASLVLIGGMAFWNSMNASASSNSLVNLSVSTGALDFGSQQVGTTSGPKNVTVTNDFIYSENQVAISSVSVTGDFAATNPGCIINLDGTCDVPVTFKPTAPGPRTGVLTIVVTPCAFAANVPKPAALPPGCTAGGPDTTYKVNLSGVGLALPTQTPTPALLGAIKGKVTLNGVPLPGPDGGVKLNGGPQRQNTDASGNYGYDNLQPGSYTVSVDFDASKYHPDGPTSLTVNVTKGSITSNVNFNLLSGPAPTPTTATPTQGGGVENRCNPPGPSAGQIDLVTCRQRTVGADTFVVDFVLNNGLPNPVDVGSTVIIGLASGVTPVSINPGIGNAVSTGGGIRWNGFVLKSFGSALLEVTLKANVAAGQTSVPLVTSVVADAKDTVTANKYGKTLGAFNSDSPLSVATLPLIPGVPGPNCQPVKPTQGLVELAVCRLDVQTESNGNIRYVERISLLNGLTNTIDVRNSVDVNVAPGVTLVSVQADTGSTRTEGANNRVVWNGFTLPPQGTATLLVTLEAPPTSANQTSTVILSGITVTAKDMATGSQYEGRVGAIASADGLFKVPLQPVGAVPGKLPVAGTSTSGNSVSQLVLLGTGLMLLGLALILSAYQVYYRFGRRK